LEINEFRYWEKRMNARIGEKRMITGNGEKKNEYRYFSAKPAFKQVEMTILLIAEVR
jgi:hypothetical protein